MNKPTAKQRKPIYDYIECSRFLEQKYGYDECNYKKHRFDLEPDDPNNPAYCNFWHWVTDNYIIHNGCDITLCETDITLCKEDWQREIFMHYIEEFGSGQIGSRVLDMHVRY